MGLIAGGLWAMGRDADERATLQTSIPAVGPTGAETPSRPSMPTGSGSAEAAVPLKHPTRALAPPDAWLVADFQGDITGEAPFADSEGFCAQVPPPSRVVLALLPPSKGKADGPDVLLAAPQVDDVFWGCVRDRVVRAGGIALAQNDQFEVLKSPSGVVARGPQGSLVFLSGEAHLERALGVLSDLSPSAAGEGRHLALFRKMHPTVTEAPRTLADLTLALPPGWLDSVGKEAEASPLRALTAAYLTVGLDRAASGGMECEEQSCGKLLAFLRRAEADLLKDAPPEVQYAVQGALSMQHLPGTGRISITWSPTGAAVSQLLTRMMGGLLGFPASPGEPAGSPAAKSP